MKEKAVFDKQLLHRALMNIMTNAADHTPEGGRIDLKLCVRLIN
ncbi:hypothetical protein PO124_12555 [Bacillus licheniformis]|nr:hypothetical protein [Bacillus licheniformis]